MGKLLCDTATATVTDSLPPPPPLLTWRDPPPSTTTTNADVDVEVTPPPSTSWDDVAGLEEQQRKSLSKLHAKGVLWKHSQDDKTVVFKLSHGGDVEADGNCLFSAVEKAAAVGGCCGGGGVRELRKVTVKRFENEFGNLEKEEKEKIEKIIKNMYSPDLKCGWGINLVQEVKFLAKKSDRPIFDDAILQLLDIGMIRETAAETIYKERCIAVEDGPSWAKYMSISGSCDDEYDIITLQYTEEGLLTIDENREGHAAAFGDDIAIECLANEFKREIYVVQAHGSDAMVDEDNCVFFLPHRPRGEITGPPIFLFMKGTGWCGAGADHYEPLIAHPCSFVSQEKVGFVL